MPPMSLNGNAAPMQAVAHTRAPSVGAASVFSRDDQTRALNFTDNQASTTSVLVAAAARVLVAASTGDATPVRKTSADNTTNTRPVCERENSETINITPRSEQVVHFSDNEQVQGQQHLQFSSLKEQIQYEHHLNGDELPMDSYLLTDKDQKTLSKLDDCLSFSYDSIDVGNPTLCKLAVMALSNTGFYLPATEYYNARPITPDISLAKKFVKLVEKNYHKNPYHNFKHAFSVMTGTAVLLRNGAHHFVDHVDAF